jgi:membrane-associated phospholipid phosphatase
VESPENKSNPAGPDQPSLPPPRGALLAIAISCIGIAVIVCMLTIDGPIAQAIRLGPTDDFLKSKGTGRWVAEILKLPGEAWFAALAALLAALIYARHDKAAGLVAGIAIAVGSALSGINGLIKWIVGRERPFRGSDPSIPQPLEFEPFRGGLAGLFDGRNLSFPSGHASLAMALAVGLGIAFPRYRWFFFAAAAACALERVAENAHYLSEVIAGGLLGTLCAIMAWRLTGSLAGKWIARKAHAGSRHNPAQPAPSAESDGL